MLMKEFEHPIDYDLEAALPRLQAWSLVKVNTQVRGPRVHKACSIIQGVLTSAVRGCVA
jgi:hypothetical protein